MKLDKFLEHNSFKKKYSGTDIELIKKEFIQLGCEKVLWPSFEEALENSILSRRIFEKHAPIEEHTSIKNFFKQFDGIDTNRYIIFTYPKTNLDKNYMIEDVVKKQAIDERIITNLFDDDETINKLSVFEKNNKYISVMFNLVYSSCLSDTYGGYKIYGQDVRRYYGLLMHDGVPLSCTGVMGGLHSQFLGTNTRVDNDPFKILYIRKMVEKIIKNYDWQNEIELYVNLRDYFMPRISSWYLSAKKIACYSKFDLKAYKDQLRSELISNGTINVKWKNEKSLYLLVKQMYSDAIYQYKPSFLSPQSFDIYIPSLRLAIEYQGVQHYQPIDFFGGEEAYLQYKLRDEKKRKICKENNILLIEWHYQEIVSKKNLKEKVSKYDLTI
ncbi:MAG: hypothetical protein LHW64_08915 [Candidatus Cloacimonetes bacterium]|nr:hypothetical protein [Candidatus Cloacimonadota bacterium]MDY0230234.1 hypothetical protein [Candidatus Cloacimonadaceae bacterium]